MNTNIQGDFQICISVPLNDFSNNCTKQYHPIKYKFGALVNGLKGNVGILMIFETKIDDTFLIIQFLIEGFTTP